MNGWLVFCVVLLSVTLAAVVVGIALYVSRLNRAIREIADTLAEVRQKIVPLADDVRYVMVNTDGLVSSARSTVESYERVAQAIDRLIEGKTLVDVAGKVVESSKTTVSSILEGAREAVRAFRSTRLERSERPNSEQNDSGNEAKIDPSL